MLNHPHPHGRRLGVLATATLLTTTALLTGSPAQGASSPASSPSADQAAAWLAGELEAGLVPNGFGGSDTGLSIDAALLAATTGDLDTAAEVRDAVGPRAFDYATYAPEAGAAWVFANESAKLVALWTGTGADPRDIDGVDFLARLEDLTSGGRIASLEDATTENLIGQAFAVRGLTEAGSTEAAAARDYLAGLQCPDGSFSLAMPAPGAALVCTPGTANTDATALALSALSNAPGTPSAVIDRSADWLTEAANVDGSYGSDAFIPAPNSNSTGLAATALGDACRVPAADRSGDWLRSVQLTSGPDAGAVAYDAAAHAEAQASGIDEVLRDQFRRATAQAGLGLVWDADAPTPLRLTHADGTLSITGAARGQTVCLTSADGTTRLTGTGGVLEVPARAPASGSTTYAATTGPGRAMLDLAATAPPATPAPPSTPATTPAATTPAPAPRSQPTVRFGGARLVRGERHRVRVAGLPEGTTAVLRLRERTVATGTADATGRVTLRFRVRTRTGPARLVLTTRATETTGADKIRRVVRVVG